MDLVAIDVFGYGEKEYLTLMDIYSTYLWVRNLQNGHSQAEVKQEYEAWEDEFGQPKELLHDRGAEFNTIDHPSQRMTAAENPQANGKLERAHKEVANLSRVHGVDPDKAVKYYRKKEQRTAFFGGRRQQYAAEEEKRLEANRARGDKTIKKRFQVGDLVLRFWSRRSRSKDELVYSKPYKVQKVLGDRTYRIDNGKNSSTVHVDKLKKLQLPFTGGWTVHPDDFPNFLEELQIDEGELDLFEGKVFAEAMEEDWSGRSIMTPINFQECGRVWEKFKRDKPDCLVMVVP